MDPRNMIFDVDYGGVSYRAMSPADMLGAGVPAGTVLDLVKGRLKDLVDAKAEAIRSTIISPGTGQVMEYQEAQAQAFAALSAPGAATADKFPMLAASIGIDKDPSTGALAVDVLGVARAINVSFDKFLAVGAVIRRVRLAAKASIDIASSIEAAASAFDAVVWPTG